MRAFWAVELPEALRVRLGEIQEVLRQSCPNERVRWVPTANMHVTAKFLGEVPGPDLVLAAVQALEPPAPLELVLEGLGAFGGKRPRVVWAGLAGQDLTGLVEVVRALEGVMAPLGYSPESRAYRPHVTLGRLRQRGRKGPPSKLPRALEQATLEPLAFTASALTLFESSAGEGGGPVRYRSIGRWAFAGLR